MKQITGQERERIKMSTKDFSISFFKRVVLGIHISYSKNFLWYVEDKDYKYSNIFQLALVKSKDHKYGIQLIILNVLIIFAGTTNK